MQQSRRKCSGIVRKISGNGGAGYLFQAHFSLEERVAPPFCSGYDATTCSRWLPQTDRFCCRGSVTAPQLPSFRKVMKYCTHCAAPVTSSIPQGDNRPRSICMSCGLIHYRNPKMVVGCLPLWDNKILLCKRNIEPRKGFWTLPAGYLECGETTIEGARRETGEETGAAVVGLQPYRLFDIVHIGQIYLIFLCRLQRPEFHTTEESMDVRLFALEDIPWPSIAFPVIAKTLRHYCRDLQKNDFSFRLDSIDTPL